MTDGHAPGMTHDSAGRPCLQGQSGINRQLSVLLDSCNLEQIVHASQQGECKQQKNLPDLHGVSATHEFSAIHEDDRTTY